jgi:hypothetical protein
VVMGNKMLGEMGFFEVVVSLGQNGWWLSYEDCKWFYPHNHNPH